MKNHYQHSKFINSMETKFKTIMIGSLARIEDHFGFLWGHNKNNLTDKEKEFRELWEDLRTEILNHGNFHMRNAIEDMFEYLNRDKYTYKFYIDNRRQDQ